jgi:hypothetical protein
LAANTWYGRAATRRGSTLPLIAGGIMKLKKTFVLALAAAVAIAFSPLTELRAAPFGGNSQTVTNDLVHSVQMKKKKKKGKKKKGKKGKKAKGKKGAAKSCGTFKYRKGGKCLDARDKK